MRISNALVQQQPSRIAVLMELYERNFLLLEQLVPELDLPFNQAVSTSVADEPLHLIALERGRYTSSFRLTYEINGVAEPDMWVKVYRDARMAESLYFATRPRWLAVEEGDPEVERYLDAQWSRNLMLNKWLHYLLERGHGFGMSGRPRGRSEYCD